MTDAAWEDLYIESVNKGDCRTFGNWLITEHLNPTIELAAGYRNAVERLNKLLEVTTRENVLAAVKDRNALLIELDKLRAALELIRDDDSMRADEMVAVAREILARPAFETKNSHAP